MKAVFWHADAYHPCGIPIDDSYRMMITDFVRQMKGDWGIESIHLTTSGHRRYCNETHEYAFDPMNVMLNREEAFADFLLNKAKPEETYWFTEPDSRMHKMIPPLQADCAMLFREDDAVPMCAGWRLAKKSAAPFFVELRDVMRRQVKKQWHGDSDAFNLVYEYMGKPGIGIVDHNGVSIEFRDYDLYVKDTCTYTSNAMGLKRKLELIAGIS